MTKIEGAILHVDATGYWIAAALIDDGHDPDWVRMVMREKGHGDIDLAAARQWLAGNPTGMCQCAACRPAPRARIAPPAQMILI